MPTKGMWLEHPEAQDEAVRCANELRRIAQSMADGPDKEAIEDAAGFLGAISDPDCPPSTEEELRRGREWNEAHPEELARKRAELTEASANLRKRLEAEAADARREAAGAAE